MVEVEPLTPAIGAEIAGIDLRDVDVETADWILEKLIAHKVVFFRDQELDTGEHVAFARRFGELETHPVKPKEGFPEVMVLHADGDHPPAGTAYWHSDVTWRPEPSLGSILYAREVPPVGGDTLFANMEAAYEGLDDETKALIDGRFAIHEFEPLRRTLISSGADEERIARYEEKYPCVRHPIVRAHPATGRPSLYVNCLFTMGIEGMPIEEAKPLLERLYAQATKPEYQCRFRWRRNSVAFWDNRATQHYAAADYFPAVRTMERVTIEGEKPLPYCGAENGNA